MLLGGKAIVTCQKVVIGLLLLASIAPSQAKAEPADEHWDDRFCYPGIYGNVYAVQVIGSNLYVGGDFSDAGGVGASNIAKWDGRKWSDVGNGVNGSVNAIAVNGNDLYVGGSFTLAGGVAANRVAEWNGTKWSALGEGIGLSVGATSSAVWALATQDHDLYVGGFFSSAGGINATNLAKWNG